MAEGGDDPKMEFMPRYIILGCTEEFDLDAIINALEGRAQKDFLKLAAADVGRGKDGLSGENVFTMQTKVKEEAKNRSEEAVANYKKLGDADVDEEEKGTPAFGEKLPASWNLFVICVGLIESENDAQTLLTGGKAEGEEKTGVNVDFCIQLRSKRAEGEDNSAPETTGGGFLVKKLQEEKQLFLDTMFQDLAVSSEDAGDAGKLAELIVEACASLTQEKDAFEAWKADAKLVPLKGKKVSYVSKESPIGWDAFPVHEQKTEENNELGTEANGAEDDQEAQAQPTPDGPEDMTLYNSRLARVPEACVSVPLILHCLVEQVAANCLDNISVEETKGKKECEISQVNALHSYFEDALGDIGKMHAETDETDGSEELIVVEKANRLACLAAAEMINEMSPNGQGDRLVSVDKKTGCPSHGLSSEEIATLKQKWPLDVLGSRPFDSQTPLPEADRGIMRTILLNGTPKSANFSIESLNRALDAKQFGDLVHKIEDSWYSRDPMEVGKQRQDWAPGSRIYSEELSSKAMTQTLLDASQSLCGALRTAWRYCPHNDTILAVCHAHTPILRKRHTTHHRNLYPSNLARSQLPADIYKTSQKPSSKYDISPEYADAQVRECVYFPADQGRLGMVETKFGQHNWRLLYVEENETLVTLSQKFAGPARVAGSDNEKKEALESGDDNEAKGIDKTTTVQSPDLMTRFADGSSIIVQQSKCPVKPPNIILTNPMQLRVEMCGATNNVYQSRPLRTGQGEGGEDTVVHIKNEQEGLVESWRCILNCGSVVIRLVNGDTKVLMANGGVLHRKKTGQWMLVDHLGKISPVNLKDTEKNVEKKDISRGEGEDEKKEAGKEESEKKKDADAMKDADSIAEAIGGGAVQVVTQRDSKSGAVVTTRSDMMMQVTFSNGGVLVHHHDGTRIYSEKSTETKGTKQVSIDCPGFAPVTITCLEQGSTGVMETLEKASESLTTMLKKGQGGDLIPDATRKANSTPKSSRVTIEMPMFGDVLRLENGSVLLKRESGERMVIDSKSQVVYLPQAQRKVPLTRELRAGVVAKAHIPLDCYFIQSRLGIMSVVDHEENFFEVSMKDQPQCTLSRDIAPGAVESKRSPAPDTTESYKISIPSEFFPPPTNAIPPRFFGIRRDGSGYELHTEAKIQAMIQAAHFNKNSFLQLPMEDQTAKSVPEAHAIESTDANGVEDEEDIEIDDDEEDPTPVTSQSDSKAPVKNEQQSLKAKTDRDVKIMQKLEISSSLSRVDRRRMPLVPSSVRASAQAIAMKQGSSVKKRNFPPLPYKCSENGQQIEDQDLPTEDALKRPIYTFRCVTKQSPLAHGVVDVVKNNWKAFSKFQARVRKRRKEEVGSGHGSSVGGEPGVGADSRTSEVLRVQMAVIAARQQAHIQSRGANADGSAKDVQENERECSENELSVLENSKVKFLKNPNRPVPRKFFQSSTNKPLQKVAKRKFVPLPNAKMDTKRFGKFFEHPSSHKFFNLHKVLREIFTHDQGLKKKMTKPVKGKPAPDGTGELRWLPENALRANLKGMQGFVKYLSRALTNRKDPTYRTVNIAAEPYKSLLNGLRVSKFAPDVLKHVGFRPNGTSMVLEGDFEDFEKSMKEVSYFLKRISDRLAAAVEERKQPTAKPTPPKVQPRGTFRGKSVHIKPQNPNSTASEFKVFNHGGNVAEYQKYYSNEEKGASYSDPDRLQLKYRPVHYTVTNTRRRKTMEYKLPEASIGKRNEYIQREADARRRLQTSSTYHINHAAGDEGLFTKFSLSPSVVHFGRIRTGFFYGCIIKIKNDGDQTGRYIVTQPRLVRGAYNLMRVMHKPGPVASGMSVALEVQLWAGQRGEFSGNIHIQTETTEHTIAVHADISDDGPLPERRPKKIPGHVRLISRRIPVSFEQFLNRAANTKGAIEKKKPYRDRVVTEPNLPNFVSTFSSQSAQALKDKRKAKDLSSHQQIHAGSSNGRHDEAGPIPDADEATAAKSNKALEAKMLESMKKM